MKPKISVIAAIDKNSGIGKNNQLLWSIPEDLQHFKKITKGHVVIMGSKTFLSIGRPLPNRTNIVVTSNPDWSFGNCIVAHSIEEALRIGAEKEKDEIFFIGGGKIYEQSLPFADKLYLTIVEGDFPEADTYFPDYSDFKKIILKQENKNNNYHFTYLELER